MSEIGNIMQKRIVQLLNETDLEVEPEQKSFFSLIKILKLSDFFNDLDLVRMNFLLKRDESHKYNENKKGLFEKFKE
jgi:hypothetical protein